MKRFHQIILLAVLTPFLLRANPNNGTQSPTSFQFKAERVSADQVVLQWKTSDELENDGFQIQRIVAGENAWTVVAWVEGKGGVDKKVEYKLADENPVKETAYYRLRQLNSDGSFMYSKVELVEERPDLSSEVTIFPIPTSDYLNIRFNKNVLAEKIDYKIITKDGKLAQEGTLNPKGESIVTMECTESLAVGLYHIQLILDDNTRIIQKFFKGE